MTRKLRFMLVASAAVAFLFVCSIAQATPISWDIDPSQSFVRLNLADQKVTLDGTTVTIRLRNGNNNAWDDAGGRMARVDGTLASHFSLSRIQFLGGQNNAFLLEERAIRPNQASWDPNATNGDNPTGQYSNTTVGLHALGAKVRASSLGGLVTLDVGFLALGDVLMDLDSVGQGSALTNGAGSIASNATRVGLESALAYFDGLVTTFGQLVEDIYAAPFALEGGILNPATGSITDVGGLNRVYLQTINIPLAFDIEGVLLTGTISGQIRATAVIPEPSTLVLLGCAGAALAGEGYRRRRIASRRLKV